jgi:hypothetical protein
VAVDCTVVKALYVFVEIRVDAQHLADALTHNFPRTFHSLIAVRLDALTHNFPRTCPAPLADRGFDGWRAGSHLVSTAHRSI